MKDRNPIQSRWSPNFNRVMGTAPSIFAIAAPGARSLGYGKLSRHFGPDQGFYKLQAPGPVVPSWPISMEQQRSLAKQYVAGMRTLQSSGPYYLIAMCGGCQIAEQMILQLEAQGEEVRLFAILDTWVLEFAHRKWGFHLLGFQLRLAWLRNASMRERVTWFRNAVRSRVRAWTGKTKASESMVRGLLATEFHAAPIQGSRCALQAA